MYIPGPDPGGGVDGVASHPPFQMKKKTVKKVGFPQTLS